MDKCMNSTGNNNWGTLKEFFDKLNEEFSFTLDPCADEINRKCDKYYTEAENGLEQNWCGETVFCNPPYAKMSKDNPGQEAWIKKCYEESKKPNTKVVMLIPSRTDTKAFHEYIYNKAEIRFIKGRIKFDGAKYNAPFPCMVVVY